MKNLINKALSYFAEIPVERVPHTLHGTLEVCWSSGKLLLNTTQSNYSFGSLHRVLRQAMQEAGVRKNPPDRVLVLGLGAGSAVHILRQEWRLRPMITGIENDPLVLMLARKYFGLEENPGLRIIHADAAVFMKGCMDTFDLILVDLFQGNLVPPEFITHTFWDELERTCHQGGKVLFNIMVFNEKTQEQAHSLEAMAAARFPVAQSIVLPGKWHNYVIYAGK